MNPLSPFQNIARRIAAIFNQKLEVFDTPDDILIQPYRGYANAERIFLKGRVMEDEGLSDGNHESKRLNFLDSLRRLETDEIPGAPIEVTVNNQTFTTTTDHEGYFIIDQTWQPPKDSPSRWWAAEYKLSDHVNKDQSAIQATGEVFLPAPNAEYGIITDIDDTVLQTFVTSRLKLKMLIATFLRNANQRLPMEGIVDLFQAFEKGSDGLQENPFFYVSSSPWNIYDMLEQFMAVQELPKGPILLRDYGIDPSGAFSNHKLSTITHILEMYPDLPFIMLGDTASKDGDFYVELAQRFPGKIKAIYIRQTRDNRNARRMKKLIESQTDIVAVMVERSAEMEAHARSVGLLSP